jgi:hypothetical protein
LDKALGRIIAPRNSDQPRRDGTLDAGGRQCGGIASPHDHPGLKGTG